MILDGTIRNAQLSAIATTVGNGAKLQGWSGTKTSDPATAPSGTKLFEITLASPPFASPSGNSMALSGTPLTDSSADATGTLTFCRIIDSGGVGRVLLSVGTSGAEINFASLSIVSGTAVNWTSETFTQPTGTI